MKKMAEIMEELGFRPDGSDEVKKAFIKNLIKASNADELKKIKPELDKKADLKDLKVDTQISLFDKKITG